MIINFVKTQFWKFALFSLVGLGAFLLDWLFFNLFYGLGLTFILSLSLGWIISMFFNFMINRNITFSARGFSIKKQAIRWILVYLIAFLFRSGLGKLVLFILGESPLTANIAFFAGVLIAIPISFIGSLLWAFKKD